MICRQVLRKVGQRSLVTLSDLSCVIACPLSRSHAHHSYTPSRSSSLAYRCSGWLASMSSPICFMLDLQTNILMGRGRVTWINFWLERTVAGMEGGCGFYSVHVRVLALMWKCKPCVVFWLQVQNSPVCNKTELRTRNGIPLHSTDSASPGGRRNVHPCAHLHKQFLLSNQRRAEQAASDQSC